jgi:hypothetical protein
MFDITSASLVNCTNLHAVCLTDCTWLPSLDCPVPATHISCCYSIKIHNFFQIFDSCEHNAFSLSSVLFKSTFCFHSLATLHTRHCVLNLINSKLTAMQTSPPIYFFLVMMNLKRYYTERLGFLQMHIPVASVNLQCTESKFIHH